MNKEEIYDYKDVMEALKSGSKLLAFKLLRDKTDLGLKECKELIDEISDDIDRNIENHISYMRSHRLEQTNEIDNLYQKIEVYKKEESIKKEELSCLQAVLKEKKEALSNAVNNVYAEQKIYKSIADFYSILNSLYFNKYNAQLVEDKVKFEGEFYKKIQTGPVEPIIKLMSFKHNSTKIKAKAWLKFLLFAVLASLLFIISYQNFRSFGHFYDAFQEDYTFIGYFLNFVGFTLVIYALRVLLNKLLIVNSEEVLSIIKNEKNENFRQLLNYLNSINKLPKEIKDLIK